MLQSSDHFCGVPLVLLHQVHVSPVLRIPELNTALQVLDLCCFVPFKDLALFSPCMFSELQTKLMIIPPRSAPCTRECKAENTFPAFQSSVPLSAFMPVCHNHLMLWRTWLMGSL